MPGALLGGFTRHWFGGTECGEGRREAGTLTQAQRPASAQTSERQINVPDRPSICPAPTRKLSCETNRTVAEKLLLRGNTLRKDFGRTSSIIARNVIKMTSCKLSISNSQVLSQKDTNMLSDCIVPFRTTELPGGAPAVCQSSLLVKTSDSPSTKKDNCNQIYIKQGKIQDRIKITISLCIQETLYRIPP